MPRDKTARRWLQFSLWNLLLLMFVSAILVGVQKRWAERHVAAVAEITAVGGHVAYELHFDSDDRQPDVRTWLRSAVEELWPSDVLGVSLPHGTKGLRTLAPKIAALRSLQQLHVRQSDLTDDDLKHFSALNSLLALDLSGTRVTDAGLETLSHSTNLKFVDLRDTRVTDVGLERLRMALPHTRLFVNTLGVHRVESPR